MSKCVRMSRVQRWNRLTAKELFHQGLAAHTAVSKTVHDRNCSVTKCTCISIVTSRTYSGCFGCGVSWRGERVNQFHSILDSSRSFALYKQQLRNWVMVLFVLQPRKFEFCTFWNSWKETEKASVGTSLSHWRKYSGFYGGTSPL